MLLIFDKNEILQAILSNDGTACPFFNAVHDEKINLENTFTFAIPADHEDAQFVIESSLVAFKDLDSEWQLFEVKRTVETDDTSSTKQVYCDAAFYELLGDIVPTGGGNGSSAWIAVISALSQSRWEDGAMVDLGLQTTAFDHQTALGCLQQIAATWKGELQFRVTIVGNVITHRYVDLLARRGNAAGKVFVFGKDLQKVEREVDFNNVYTAMYGRGKGTTNSVRLTFADSLWTLPTNPANKPEGQEWIGDTAALAQYGLATGSRHRFGIFDDSQEADPMILLQKTWDALQIAKEPVVNYQFDALLLEQLSPDYSHEAVRIGDTTAVIDNNFSPPLRLMVRVIEIQRDILEFDKTKIVLGNFRQDLASNQAFQNRVNQQVQDNSGIWDNAAALVPSVLDPAIYDLTSELRSAGGYVVFSANDGIMVYDTPDPATATKAMKLGGGVFGIANSKNADGSWNFRTFGDGSGFTADLITSGEIKADFLQIGPGSTFDPGYDPSTANTTANTANTAAGNALAAATVAQTQATAATTTANSKRRVFVEQPTAPYEVGDLWVSTNGTGDLKTCILARATGAYVATEWMKAVKYTDDTTANAKRRVFVAQPIPPYDIGDLWVTATDASGDLKTSTVIRTVGIFTAADWVLATKYTDDATANTAIANALMAQETANTAIANATTANTLLAEMTNDNKLTAQEKQLTKTEWDSLVSEIPLNNAQADLFGITTQKTTYDNAYNALNTYVSPLLAVLITTSDIDGPTFRTTFKTFYDARTNLLNAISGKAKTLADSANTQATLAIANAAVSQTQANKGVADALTANNLIADIASDSKMTASEKQAFKGEWDSIVAEVAANDTQAANFGITTEKTTYDNAFSMLNTYMSPLLADLNTTTAMDGTTFRININTYYIARAKMLNAIALKAKTIADTAQALATSANAVIADMASDDKITPSEKQALLQDWNIIVAEEPTLEGQADTYAIVAEKSSLYTAFTALGTYLNNNVVLPAGNVPYLFSDLTTTNTIVGATLRQKFVDYYGFKDILIKAVTDAGKALSDAAQGTANTAQANADTAQATADTAVTNAYNAKTQADLGVANAATANGLLADIASDGKLTAQEKQNAKMEWDVIVAEKPTIDTQATNYSIGIDKTNYGTAYDSLSTYITPLLTSLTTTTDINGATFRATFKDYYDKKTLLLKAIADKAKTLADNAQTQADLGVTYSAEAQATADTAKANALTAQGQANTATTNAATAQTQANLGVANAATAQTQATLGVTNAAAAQAKADTGVINAAAALTQANLGVTNAAAAQTQANTATTNAATAQTQANLGVTNALTANTALGEMTNDNKLTAQEKQITKKEWDSIVSEVPLNDAQANTFSVTTEKTTYDNVYSALNTYITPLISVLTTTSDINGVTFRSNYKAYYDARTNVLNAIAAKARTLANSAQTSATTATTNAATAQTQANLGVANAATAQTQATLGVTNASVAQTKADLGVTNAAAAQTQANLGVANALTAQTQANLGVANAAVAQTQANTATTNAATAKTQADKGVADALTANNLIADIASDSKLTPSEKQAFKGEWDSIIAEVPVNDAQATTFVITTEKTNYDNAYSALNTYMSPLLTDLSVTTAMDGTTFRININIYYIARAKLLLAVSVKAKSLADTAQIRADLGITNAATAQTQANLGVTNAGAAQTTANAAKGTADAALANSATAQTQATLGVTNAATANNSLAQIASDASFSPVEKKNTQKEWTAIITEVGLNDTQAALFGITTEKTTYDNAYAALSSYITPLLADLTSVSAITGLTFRNTFYAYYTARTNLLNIIAKTTKTVADTAITNAGTAQAQADTALTTATSAIARTHWSDVSQNKVTTATGGTIAANGPTYYAGNWTSTTVGQTITIDLGSLMPQIVEIGIDSWFPSDTAKIPKNFILDYSPDNATWTNAKTLTNNAIAPYVLSTVASTFSARYVRLTVSAFQTSETTSTIGKFWVSSLQGAELTFAQNLVGAIQTATNALQISSTMYADGSGMWLVGAGGQNVVRITSGGIAVGTAGTGGAFTTAITGTGIVATAITSGTIDAGKMTVINLNAGSITAGTMVADRISGGTLAGVIITASSVLGVSSNMWNAGTSNGIILGGVVGGYGGPATLKLNQGLTGDGNTSLNLVVTNGGLDIVAPFGTDFHDPVTCYSTLSCSSFSTLGDIQLGSTSSIRNTVPVKLLNGGAALGLNAGQLLASNDYLDVSKVPTNGIYSKGGYGNLAMKIAYSWTGTIATGTSVAINHNLGYKPIVDLDGTLGNTIVTQAHGSVNQVTIYDYINGWTGTVRLF